MGTTHSTLKQAGPGPGRSFLAWQVFVGNLRQRPLLAVVATALSLALIAGVVVFVVYPECWAWYHWWQADQAARDYEFATARKSLQNCSQVWSKSGEVHFRLARACRRDGNMATARAELAIARRYHWSEAALELEASLIQAQSGSVRPVEKSLHSLLEQGHDDSLVILEALVVGYLQNNYLSEAHQWLMVWTRLHPEMWQPHLLLASLYERRYRAGLAVAEYQQALHLKPDQPEASFQLANLLVGHAKLYDDALPHYERYVRLRPDDAAGHVGLGKCQRALGNRCSAQSSAEKSLRLAPDNPSALLLLGLLAWDEERLDEARGWLAKAWKVSPNEVDTNHALAAILRELGRPAEAVPYEQRRQSLETDLRRLSEILQVIHDLEFRTGSSLETGGAKGRALALRREVAAIYQRTGDDHASLGWLLSALQQAPEDPETRRQVTELRARLQGRGGESRPPGPPPAQGLGEPLRPRPGG